MTSLQKSTLALACTLFLSPLAFAQDTTTPPPGAPPANQPTSHQRDHGQRGDKSGPGMDRGGDRGGPGGDHGMMGGPGGGPESRILPGGPWWRNPQTVTAIGLSADQTKRIDDIFMASRLKLVDQHAALEKDELLLEPMLKSAPFDEARARTQIFKIADMRAELEKTNAAMLLSIRSVLTADQWKSLQSQHGGMHHEGDRGMNHGPNSDMHHDGAPGGNTPPHPPAAE